MRRAEAQLRVDRDELALQKELEANGAASQRVLDLAQARVEVAQAELDVSRASTDSARAQVQALGAKYARAKTELELRLSDTQALAPKPRT
jgi:multidrug resistance efflux pump